MLQYVVGVFVILCLLVNRPKPLVAPMDTYSSSAEQGWGPSSFLVPFATSGQWLLHASAAQQSPVFCLTNHGFSQDSTQLAGHEGTALARCPGYDHSGNETMIWRSAGHTKAEEGYQLTYMRVRHAPNVDSDPGARHIDSTVCIRRGRTLQSETVIIRF